MKSLLLFLLMVTAFPVVAQKPLKDFYLKRRLTQGGFQYEFSVLDEDKHGVFNYKKNRFYFWYKAQSVMATQGESAGVLLHGEFESFHNNGQLYEKGEFGRGLKKGEWMQWRNDGSLVFVEDWSKGELKAKKWYNENGDIYKAIQVKGYDLTKNAADTLIIRRKFGKESRYYNDKNGKLTQSEELKDGQLHGKTRYYEDGKHQKTEKYKKGELISSSDDVVEKKDKEGKEEKEKANDEKPKRSWFKRKEKEEKTEKESEPKEKKPLFKRKKEVKE